MPGRAPPRRSTTCTGGSPPPRCARLLGGLVEHCKRDDAGRLLMGRDHRVLTAPELAAGVYVPGATEHSHGLGSTLLSDVAVRAGEIAASVAAGLPAGLR